MNDSESLTPEMLERDNALDKKMKAIAIITIGMILVSLKIARS